MTLEERIALLEAKVERLDNIVLCDARMEITNYACAQAAWCAIIELAIQFNADPAKVAEALASTQAFWAHQRYVECEDYKAAFGAALDKRTPEQMAMVPDAPPSIFGEGDS